MQQQMNQNNSFLMQQQLNQQQFMTDLQSNQFLESQQQQHQQHMARNNAIAGNTQNTFGMMNNMNNLSSMNIPFQNMMMNQVHQFGSPNMVNQRISVWTGALAWVVNQPGMQPVEIQCGVTAIPASTNSNPQMDE
jgi:hypothetical protein